jgi:hypothetical protein
MFDKKNNIWTESDLLSLLSRILKSELLELVKLDLEDPLSPKFYKCGFCDST